MTAILVLAGCKSDGEPSQEKYPSQIVDKITVSIASRDVDDGEGDGNTGDTPDNEDDNKLLKDMTTDELIPYELKFDDSSVVFVSQMVEGEFPFQTSDNIYSYEYRENPDADWDNEYNFTPKEGTDPLEWFKIGLKGSYGNGFALFALYFPDRDEIISREEKGKIYYSVEQDQSTLENLKKSDILGAYHSTPSLFARLQFRLFHLMTYLRIRVYVPVYNEEKRTGYYDNSLISATLSGVTPEFAVDWGILRSPDTEGPPIAQLNGDGEIKMYQHPLQAGKSRKKMVLKDISKKFLPNDYIDQNLPNDEDEVRVYDFSVIIPMQRGEVVNGTERPFTENNFLHFLMRSNSGAENEYYFNQEMSANATESNLGLSQGVFQVMELYLPRVGNKVICMTSSIVPWNERKATFPLGQQDEEPGDWNY